MMGNLPYSDTTLGREYNSGGKETFKSGAEADFESGAALKLAGTPVTANAAELNTLDGTATTWPALLPSAPTFTIGTEASNIINVAVQLNDSKSNAIAASKAVWAYLSESSTGDGIAGTAPTDAAIGTDGAIIVEFTTDEAWLIWTESDGQFDLDITYTAGALTLYLCVVVGSNLYVSDAITFS